MSPDVKQKLITRYQNGEHASVLAEEYLGNKNKYRYIFEILASYNIPKRTRSQVKRISDQVNLNPHLNERIYDVDEDYFEEWSHNMAYLLGYIATDGNISNNRVVKFGLKASDTSLLEKIKEELKFTGNIYPKIVYSNKTGKDYPASVMNIYNRKMCSDLKGLGIVEDKSLILGRFDCVPEEYEMSFLLGVFDGDGSVGRSGGASASCKNSIQIRTRFFSGSRPFMEYI